MGGIPTKAVNRSLKALRDMETSRASLLRRPVGCRCFHAAAPGHARPAGSLRPPSQPVLSFQPRRIVAHRFHEQQFGQARHHRRGGVLARRQFAGGEPDRSLDPVAGGAVADVELQQPRQGGDQWIVDLVGRRKPQTRRVGSPPPPWSICQEPVRLSRLDQRPGLHRSNARCTGQGVRLVARQEHHLAGRDLHGRLAGEGALQPAVDHEVIGDDLAGGLDEGPDVARA